jgi:uncharacterized protein
MPTRIPNWRARYDQWFTTPQTVVVQPTTWCNLDCGYCYLPLRKLRHQMPPSVAAALATSVTQLTAGGGPPIGIVWHGGEPLAIGPQKFTALLAPFEVLRREGRVQHYVQTNATLITDTWCELLTGSALASTGPPAWTPTVSTCEASPPSTGSCAAPGACASTASRSP